MRKNEANEKQHLDVGQQSAKNFSKKKTAVIIGMIIILIATLISLWYVYERNINQWDVREKQVTIEYGRNLRTVII